jgi:uncharacterized membrane protein (DUF485 family)
MISKSTSNKNVQDVNQLSRLTRNRRVMKVQFNLVVMSTRSRKQVYATALTLTFKLESYYSVFFIELKRSDQVKNSERLYYDFLSIESRYWKKMLNHRFSRKFNLAVIKELVELKKRETFELIEKKNQFTLSLTWMFKYKYNINDFLIKFKAWLCAREDLQLIKRDTYAAILAAKTFKALIVISAVFDLEIKQYDAVNAFINSKIDEEIFIECLEKFLKFKYCWKLKKALYDLKQSSILWYRELIMILKKMRMILVSEIDCLFINERIILFFYINNIVILCSKFSIDQLRIFEQTLMKRFEIKSLEDLKWFLSIEITWDRENRKIWCEAILLMGKDDWLSIDWSIYCGRSEGLYTHSNHSWPACLWDESDLHLLILHVKCSFIWSISWSERDCFESKLAIWQIQCLSRNKIDYYQLIWEQKFTNRQFIMRTIHRFAIASLRNNFNQFYQFIQSYFEWENIRFDCGSSDKSR